MSSYKVGILIIGSLSWDKREHRESWRRDRLEVEAAIPVSAPIRYGRVSNERSKTYTMVFSNELLPRRTGWALVLPCRGMVSTGDELVKEAQTLWAAEQPRRSTLGPVSARWGAVGLLLNPSKTGLEQVRNGWTQRVAQERQHYTAFDHSANEQPAVNADGILSIPWPTTESGGPLNADFLLATATVPTLNNRAYATPQVVAEAWNRAPKEQRYFDENRRSGITTADDYNIMRYLGGQTPGLKRAGKLDRKR